MDVTVFGKILSKGELIGFCFGGAILLFMLGGITWAIFTDIKKWNKGICNKCYQGVWVSDNCDSGGCSSYHCTNCGDSWWEMGYGKKNQLNPNDPLVIRSLKIKHIKKSISEDNKREIRRIFGIRQRHTF